MFPKPGMISLLLNVSQVQFESSWLPKECVPFIAALLGLLCCAGHCGSWFIGITGWDC